MREQKAIQEEQRAIRGDLQRLVQKIDAQLKGEVQSITRRIDANDARLSKISGESGGAATPFDTGASGGGGGGYPGRQQAPPRMSSGFQQQQQQQRPAPMSSPIVSRGLGGGPGGGGSSFGGRSPVGAKKSEQALGLVKAALSKATQQADKNGSWEEPGEAKASSSAIDRFEQALKQGIERTKEFQKARDNPMQCMQSLFNRMDRNHSGKVDPEELQNLCKVIEMQGDTQLMGSLFARYDVDHSGTLTVEEFSRSMFKLDGDSHFKARTAIAKMREVLSLRAGGFESLKAIYSQFRIIDRDHSGQLSKEEFDIALDILFSAYKVTFTQAEKNSLFQFFDKDKCGALDYDEFVRGIRGEMNDFRIDWVKQAFAVLDTDGSGIVTTQEIGSTYDPSQNPAVQSGKLSPQDAIRQFMKQWDGNNDGKITMEEFLDNYQWVSASIDNDDYFELMIRNAWHITGGEGWAANTSNMRVLVKHNNAPDEVVCITHDMGLPRDPAKKYQEVVKRLQAQGVKDIQKIEFAM